MHRPRVLTLWEKSNELPKTTGNYILVYDVSCASSHRIKDGNKVVLNLYGGTVSGGSAADAQYNDYYIDGGTVNDLRED